MVAQNIERRLFNKHTRLCKFNIFSIGLDACQLVLELRRYATKRI